MAEWANGHCFASGNSTSNCVCDGLASVFFKDLVHIIVVKFKHLFTLYVPCKKKKDIFVTERCEVKVSVGISV